MMRIISLISPGNVYHKDGCPYVQKISGKYKKWVNVNDRRYRKYRECKYCGGIRGYARVFGKRPERHSKEKKVSCYYEKATGYIYLKTDIGFWKIVYKQDTKRFLLFHLNRFDPSKKVKEMMKDRYQRQNDVGPSDNFDSLVNYIVAHDKSKKIMADDYRKLPHKTFKEKKYYEKAKQKAKRQESKRMEELFESIRQG